MKILICTQYLENYGTATDPYWKNKGGNEFIVDLPEDFRQDHEMAEKKALMLADALVDKIEYKNAFTEEYVVGISLVEDDFMTSFEQSQLELDGEILYPANRVSYEQFFVEPA